MLGIAAKTIYFHPPENGSDRQLARVKKLDTRLADGERVLRQKAYYSSSIDIPEFFFDDSDLSEKYALIVVYHVQSKRVLLSARYYWHQPTILTKLKQDDQFALQDNCILIDRMSSDTSSSSYRRFRGYIHLLFYREVLVHNKGRSFLIMARKQPKEKLLSQYLFLGFRIVGRQLHNGVEHWVLLGDEKTIYGLAKISKTLHALLIFGAIKRKFMTLSR